MIERHIMKLRRRDDISAEEEKAIAATISDVRDVPADRTIIRAGETLDHSTLLLEGFLCRYKDLRNGQRQITELHVPGDFADLHSFTLKRLDHSVMTLTPSRLAVVPHERIRETCELFPHLTRVWWFATNLDAAIHREWEVSLGRRNARARVAHLFCELFLRLEIVGLTDGDGFAMPLTQEDIAECLGLTAVHVNRTLRELREDRLLEVRGGRASILDQKGLRAAAEFDPAYLYLEHIER